MDGARRVRPESDWIAGQEIRYLVEHGLADSAVSVALGCQGTGWWCQALAGYAFHAAERFREADSSFALATLGMPRRLFCQWTDWSKLLEGRLYERFRSLDCERRAKFADTLFTLSQPLLSRPGNDLRTELFARRVMSLLVASAHAPEPWSQDIEEIGVRYGWPTRWSIADRGFYPTMDRPPVVGHDRSPAYFFFAIPTTDSAAPPWRWELEPERPRSRYAPTYAANFAAVEGYQIARFPRGDSTIVVATLEGTLDSGLRSRPVGHGLAVLTHRGAAPTITRTDSASELRPDRIMVAGDPLLVSVESWTLSGRRIARVRQSYPPLDRSRPLLLSTPLLFRPGEALPASLEEAASRALPSTSFPRGAPVGVYWEASGIGADSVDVSIAVVPVRRGLMGRIGEGLSLVKRRAALTLQWSAPAERAPAVGRAFELDLHRQKPGKYRLRLEAHTPDGTTAATELPLELRP